MELTDAFHWLDAAQLQSHLRDPRLRVK